MWQAYNDGKKTTFESTLTLVLEGVQLEVECLKGYETIQTLGTTAVDHSILVGRLSSTGETFAWFVNYLKECSVFRQTSSVSATACHQGSTPRLDPRLHILSPSLIYTNAHTVASPVKSRWSQQKNDDDTVLYSTVPSPDFVLNSQQQSDPTHPVSGIIFVNIR